MKHTTCRFILVGWQGMEMGAIRLIAKITCESRNLNDHASTAYRLIEYPAIFLRAASTTKFAIRRLTSSTGHNDFVGNLPPDKAFLISVHLRRQTGNQWETRLNNAPIERERFVSGGVGIYDLEARPAFLRNSAFDCVHYFLPKSTIDAFTDEAGWPRVRSLRGPGGARDHVLHHMADMIVPSLQTSGALSLPYFQQYLSLFCAYLISTYGTMQSGRESLIGGLAPWQQRWVREAIHHNPAGSDVKVLSAACGLSQSHFARCFKLTFGMSVHRYVLQQRIISSKPLLLNSGYSLSEIALKTGFADQSAFGRTFAAFVGLTPAKWRREHLHAPRVFAKQKGEVD